MRAGPPNGVPSTFKVSNDPDFEAKKNRVLELYDIADHKTQPRRGDPSVVICFDESEPASTERSLPVLSGSKRDPAVRSSASTSAISRRTHDRGPSKAVETRLLHGNQRQALQTAPEQEMTSFTSS